MIISAGSYRSRRRTQEHLWLLVGLHDSIDQLSIGAPILRHPTYLPSCKVDDQIDAVASKSPLLAVSGRRIGNGRAAEPRSCRSVALWSRKSKKNKKTRIRLQVNRSTVCQFCTRRLDISKTSVGKKNTVSVACRVKVEIIHDTDLDCQTVEL